MIQGELLGGDELAAVMRVKAPTFQRNFGQAILRLTVELLRNVKDDKLSGQVLNVRTGRLRRSINQRTSGLDTPQPEGVVGTNVVYARPHEYGFKGVVSVKTHMRIQKQAFGKAITPVEVTVPQHSRRVNLPEKSFLRSALADLQPRIKEELERVAK
jgi:phage gpG-like protein